MTRFLAGVGAGLIVGGIARLFTASVPWLLFVGGCTAVVVWFGRAGAEFVSDLIDDVT